MNKFLGKSSFVWWHGVVEDVADPFFLGRCKIRIFGFHTDILRKLPTNDLPWAYPMQPITSAALSGIGTSPTGLLVGSHVFGFFRDGEDAQDPVVVGSFGGIPQESADKTKGFNDPSEKYPAKDSDVKAKKFPLGISVIKECDTNKLATGQSTADTIVQYKIGSVVKNIKSTPKMASSSVWNEPITPYGAVYPKNHVRYTESGHIQEFDDTPGKERVHTWHTSGTFTEIANGWEESPKGTRVQRIQGDDYEICHGNKNVYIKGTKGLNLVIEGGMNVTIVGGGNIQLTETMNILAMKDINMEIKGTGKITGKQLEFFSEGKIGFYGKSISFSTTGGAVGEWSGGNIGFNSGPASLVPSKLDLK